MGHRNKRKVWLDKVIHSECQNKKLGFERDGNVEELWVPKGHDIEPRFRETHLAAAFRITQTISKLRIFLLLWLNRWDLLYCQGMSLGNGISTSVVEFAINTLCIFSSTNISHALLFARSYGASNRASCTSAYNLQKALSPSNITRID